MFSCSTSYWFGKMLTVNLLAEVLSITETGNYCLAFSLSTTYFLAEEVLLLHSLTFSFVCCKQN